MLFSLLPKELVAALAGLALLGAIATNISVAMKMMVNVMLHLLPFSYRIRYAFSWIKFSFWGICIGVIAHFILTPRSNPATN